MKGFDEKMAQLGYQAKDNSGKPKKSHHNQQTSPSADAEAKSKGKGKA